MFIVRNESFICLNCNRPVTPHDSGSCRNHCPKCLFSLHVDDKFPGDRQSKCHGLMEPVRLTVKNTEVIITHKCLKCGQLRRNISAPDDDQDTLIQLSVTGGVSGI